MKMTASTRLVSGVTIVDLSGRIVLGEGSAELRDLVRNLVSEGIKKILLNLRNVDYIDSSGLGVLVSAFTSMRSQSGELKLLNLTKRVRSLLQITKLLTVFDITNDEATSVKSFSPAIWPSSLPDPIMGQLAEPLHDVKTCNLGHRARGGINLGTRRGIAVETSPLHP